MGGSSSPPFLYDPVSQWSFNDYHRGKPFNPKAVTQASWTPRPQSTPQEGPLVNFNRHPDTPSVAILHNIYAIYHLVRSAASRPPGSSTSYHLFASIMDAGLVPFYAFISFVAHKEFHDGYYNWGTVFDDEKLEHYIVESLFYASAGVGGLHLPIPFMHTRQQSSTSLADPKRASRTSLHSNQQSARVYNGENQPASPSRAAVQTPQKSPSRPRSILEDAPVLRPTSSGLTPSNLRWSSPVPSEASANWVSYESPEDEDVIIRESKPPSRSKNGTPFPMSNGANDWLAPVPKFGRVESGIPHNEARGQYAALETNDGYDNDVHFDINKDSLEEDITEYLNRALDPLRMNPPTPQPKEDAENTNAGSRPSSLRRAVLGEIPDVSAVRNNTNIADAVVADDTELPASKPAKLRTFGSLRLWGSKSNKTTYASVKEDEASDNESDNENEASQPARLRTPKRRTTQNTVTEKEADRKGRVVSNSGIDLGSAYHTGMDSEQYSEYISTLGVGRRRDVSGKIAEEGRGGIAEVTETPEVPRTPEKKQNTTRAAGWARFAGL
uniref:Protein translocase subunit SecA n=1 Tax=Talaromyces marneffei PM1 TaxID=1077442 RepID=A0A093VJL1_TALMA